MLIYQIFHPKIIQSEKAIDSEFLYIEVWFTDQNFKLLETEDRTKINLVINYKKYKKLCTIQFNQDIKYL